MLIYEKYPNTDAFIAAINSRENNRHMHDEKQSHKRGAWSGTDTWEDAVNLYSNGIPAKAHTIKAAIGKAKSQVATLDTGHKVRPRNYYYGYAPNVPAALAGMPKSMRQNVKTPPKVKCINLVYDCGMNFMIDADQLEKAGTTVLQLVSILEYAGYRVNLDLCVICAHGRQERDAAVCLIGLKEFKQPLDLLKLSFPVTCPAMFRRFGFRWLETVPAMDNSARRDTFNGGYGHHAGKEPALQWLSKSGYDVGKTHLINVDDCSAARFDPLELAKKINLTL